MNRHTSISAKVDDAMVMLTELGVPRRPGCL